MPSPSGRRQLSTAAYTILGLLARNGPSTTYDLKGLIEISIGYFWPFPHSQMYAEVKRLEAAEFIEVDAEVGGRGRRTLRITAAGEEALTTWWEEADDGVTEIRDAGLLKLFLADPADTAGIRALADEQEAAHAERLATYEKLQLDIDGLGDPVPPSFATLRMGLTFERAAVSFWSAIAEEYGSDRG